MASIRGEISWDRSSRISVYDSPIGSHVSASRTILPPAVPFASGSMSSVELATPVVLTMSFVDDYEAFSR
jgi:hypothetical protein